MNKIDELRNYADNLRIKNELNHEALKRDQLLISKLKNENKKLKDSNKELMEIVMNIRNFNNDLMDLNIKYCEEIERLRQNG